VRALLQTRLVTKDDPQAQPQTISIRARSVGGVDLAPAPNDGALLAWSAIDGGSPQVFLTLLDARGGRVLQRMLTRSRGEVSDVAVAEVEGGWVVGWISERDGDPEVYAARVDRALKRVGHERRITTASGTATGLRLLSRGSSVLAVWSDSRGPKARAWLTCSPLSSPEGCVPMGSEVQVSETRWHSHSPVLAAAGEGAVLGWVESTGAESNAPSRAPECAWSRSMPRGGPAVAHWSTTAPA